MRMLAMPQYHLWRRDGSSCQCMGLQAPLLLKNYVTRQMHDVWGEMLRPGYHPCLKGLRKLLELNSRRVRQAMPLHLHSCGT
mmetsp:Transcript_14384/g.29837  ORF Transcript_14384/g.29837 Transcript_14384/m.29837 type:complete len:82 (-) Transcript_14384:32-277(-)